MLRRCRCKEHWGQGAIGQILACRLQLLELCFNVGLQVSRRGEGQPGSAGSAVKVGAAGGGALLRMDAPVVVAVPTGGLATPVAN